MKSNDLFKKIHFGEVKDNTKIDVLTEHGSYITTILYKDGRMNWKQGEFDTKWLCDIGTEFELIQEDTIDIGSIEEFKTNKAENESTAELRNYINGEILRSIKQLDRKLTGLEGK